MDCYHPHIKRPGGLISFFACDIEAGGLFVNCSEIYMSVPGPMSEPGLTNVEQLGAWTVAIDV
eukprot:364899-Chlamydomonas_euryale.AAC.27